MESKLPHTKPQQPDLNGKWPSVLTKHIFRNNSQNYSIINIAKFTGYFSLSKIGTHIRWFTICNSLIWLSFYQLLGSLPYRWALYGSRGTGILQITIRIFTSFKISAKLLQNCDNAFYQQRAVCSVTNPFPSVICGNILFCFVVSIALSNFVFQKKNLQ